MFGSVKIAPRGVFGSDKITRSQNPCQRLEKVQTADGGGNCSIATKTKRIRQTRRVTRVIQVSLFLRTGLVIASPTIRCSMSRVRVSVVATFYRCVFYVCSHLHAIESSICLMLLRFLTHSSHATNERCNIVATCEATTQPPCKRDFNLFTFASNEKRT